MTVLAEPLAPALRSEEASRTAVAVTHPFEGETTTGGRLSDEEEFVEGQKEEARGGQLKGCNVLVLVKTNNETKTTSMMMTRRENRDEGEGVGREKGRRAKGSFTFFFGV